MKKLSLVILSIALFASSSQAQNREDRREKKEEKRKKINELIRQAEEGVLVYEKQNIFGIQLRTNGYGAFYELGRMKTNRRSMLYRIDLSELKNHKEEKFGGGFFFGNPFIYGKANYFYSLTLGVGQQYILGQKGNKNGVAVSAVAHAGLALGMLRPYYVEAIDANNREVSIKYEDDPELFLSNQVQGASGLGKGWGEMKLKPGAFAKAAMRFDYGRFNESVNGLEIGMELQYYSGDIPIMLFQDDKKMFFSAYLAILFGRRK